MKMWGDHSYQTVSMVRRPPRARQVAKEVGFVLLFLGILLAGSITEVRGALPDRYDAPRLRCWLHAFQPPQNSRGLPVVYVRDCFRA